eukprot:Plantae.Rhodophyta-Purpureofilum_apyrenoidigerum.ctg10239.p1 GENE.Plantae.Rhodophyta-Purpureofilum_apyrenoidigerum.ctg10239~~Plantae.Rhodophyta-Purpureofilum_apyrenoidigerum.ctg10239.p1  ORF type:complete len:607 (+),score=147.43 Plantae.Rhodophyta-Purpureofilum_apyrenoidigerum.ctg10239:252-2072(+)
MAENENVEMSSTAPDTAADVKQNEDGGDDSMQEGEKPAQIELPVLQVVKSEQMSNDMKNANYRRYHQHCTNKLRKLRKNLKFSHGRGKTFQKRDITIDVAKRDPKFLMLLLMGAERAWCLAMVIKEDRKGRKYVVRRFRKAAKLAEKLATFTKEIGDDRTVLEAEAYAAWMSATSLLERENWTAALKKFLQAQKVFEGLARAFGSENRLYQDRLEELKPSIRFCQWSARGSGEDTAVMMDMDSAVSPRMDDVLAAKINDALAVSRKAQAESFGSVEWCGKTLPIRIEKLREAILEAREAIHTMEQEMDLEKKAASYDKIFIAFNDAGRIVSKRVAEIRGAKDGDGISQKDEERLKEFEQLGEYITYSRLRQTIARNTLLLDRLDKSSSKPDDFVRLYETLRQNSQEILDLDGVISHEDTRRTSEAELTKFAALRCFYLAKSYQRSGQWAESTALFRRAEMLLNDVAPMCERAADKDAKFVRDKAKDCVRFLARVHAQGVLENAQLVKDVKTHMTIVDANNEDSVLRSKNFTSFVEISEEGLINGRIYRLPPRLRAVPCKPVSFDIAVDGIRLGDPKEVTKQMMAANKANKGEQATENKGYFKRWLG